MKTVRLLSIVGTRPQFVKHAIMQREFQRFEIEETLLHTGQHFDVSMSDVFFQSLRIKKPDIVLETQSSLSEMLRKLDNALSHQSFDYVLVYGDTTSTLAGSLFAKEHSMRLVHIEAGLRSGDLTMPEERNRLICDHLSDILFAPTQEAMCNLKKEGARGEAFLSGDVMKDSFSHFLPQSIKPQGVEIPSSFVLCTLHRQSNVDNQERLAFLLQGLNEIAQEIAVILPLHPRTQKRMAEFGLELSDRVCVIAPQGYLEMLWLLQACQCVLTDSGGLQKEAYFAKKQCLILREVSEWKELVECGACELLGHRDLKSAFHSLSAFSAPCDVYGEGKSVEKILQILTQRLLTNYI